MLMPTETLNTDLVELEDIEKVKKLPVLLIVLQFHVVLLQPVQRQLGLVIHEDLHRLREGGVGAGGGQSGGVKPGGVEDADLQYTPWTDGEERED